MATVVEKARAAAQRAVARVPETGIFDVETQVYSTVTMTTTRTTTPVSCRISVPVNYEQEYVDGDVIRRDDMLAMLAALDAEAASIPFVPKNGMLVTIAGIKWHLEKVTAHPGGSLVAAWELQLRR